MFRLSVGCAKAAGESDGPEVVCKGGLLLKIVSVCHLGYFLISSLQRAQREHARRCLVCMDSKLQKYISGMLTLYLLQASHNSRSFPLGDSESLRCGLKSKRNELEVLKLFVSKRASKYSLWATLACQRHPKPHLLSVIHYPELQLHRCALFGVCAGRREGEGRRASRKESEGVRYRSQSSSLTPLA
eukprot:scaffold42351_cov24-Prasinocladus_malaysianus.AAC.1